MISKDLVAASAKPLVLSILSERESYGYEIIRRVKDLSGGQMQWKEGMLYPVLHRLEEQGLVSSEWRTADSGRKRRYYYLKDEGWRALKIEKRQWSMVHSTLTKLWGTEQCLT